MKTTRRTRFSSTTMATDFIYSNENTPTPQSKPVIKIPIQNESIPMPQSRSPETSATKIQSVYRSHKVRTLVKIISAVNLEANYWESFIQRQETVDAIRTNELERTKINEALMGLLLKLDSVPGTDPAVRGLRRHVSHRIVGLQEILDAVSDPRLENFNGFLKIWDDDVANIEKQVCQDRGGGYELEKFCSEYLGFSCLQRFLGDQ